MGLCAGEYSSLWVPLLRPAGQVDHNGGHDKENKRGTSGFEMPRSVKKIKLQFKFKIVIFY